LLGGWITDNISWPWIFYINIPVGVFAAIVTWSIYRNRETARHKLPIDGVGLGLLVLWVGALQIMLDKGQELDWFHSSTIIALAAVAVIVFCLFIAWELVENPYPVVDLRLFKRRNFWTGTLALALGYGVFFGNVVIMPLWLQQYMGYTATEAGMLTAPVGILALLLSPFVGRWVGKFDLRLLASVAFLIFAISLYMRTRYNTQANFGFLVVPIIVQGAAMAFFFVPLVSLVLSGLTPERVPAASGLSNFARIVSGSFGTSIATTLWDNRAILHHAQLTEYVRNSSMATRDYVQTLQAGGLSFQQAGAVINRSIDVESHLLAANDLFWISSILFLLMIGVIWLARPIKANLAPGAVGGAH
jgi:DHA2 family multidrug resistance protein